MMLKKTGYLLLGALLISGCGGGGGSRSGDDVRQTVLFGAREIDGGEKVLWRTDGTEAGTQRVFSWLAMPREARFSPMVALGGQHYFAATQFAGQSLLWVTDGTESGTAVVESAFYPGPISPANMVAVGDVLYFTAAGGVGVRDLWRTDGTPEGTYRLDEVAMPGLHGNPSSIRVSGQDLFMLIDAGVEERALIRLSTADDTWTTIAVFNRRAVRQMLLFRDQLAIVEHVDGHYRLSSLDPDSAESLLLVALPERGAVPTISAVMAVEGLLYFQGIDEAHGMELWVSDGTADGTSLHTDFTPGEDRSYFREFYAMGDTLIVSAVTGNEPMAFWAVDNASSAPRKLFDTPAGGREPIVAGLHQGSLYFHNLLPDDTSQLCAVSISNAALRCLQVPVSPVPSYSVIPLNNALLFVGQDAASGNELWRTPLSLNTAHRLADICPGVCRAF